MELKNFIEQLQNLHNQVGNVEVSIETVDDNGTIYYEENFDLFVDDNNEIGLSPINK